MKYFTVHAPPEEPAEPERFLFVKDGFSWPALFFPLLWILWHRMWLTLVYYVVFVMVVLWADLLLGEDPATWIAILGSLLFALEANNLRRLSLEQRGWEEVGGSFGANLSEAEARFYSGYEDAAAPSPLDRRAAMVRAAYPPSHRAEHARPAADEPILGLFPEPER